MSSFVQRKLKIDITLGEGSFDGKGNQKSFEDFETVVSIEKPGLPDKAKAKVDISNLEYNTMQQLTMLAFKPLKVKKNTIAIYAAAENGEYGLAFSGEIMSAYADFSQAPKAVMHLEAEAGGYAGLIAKGPVAAKGEVQASKLIQQFASEMGYTFKNEGVTASVKNAVFNGTPLEKARAVAAQVGAQLIVDDNKVILLDPQKGRSGQIPLLSAKSGMLGYPSFNNEGITVTCLFNPNLELGGMVKVESIVPGASGEWKISKLTHNLTANSVSPGPWNSVIDAAPLDGGKSSKSKSKNSSKTSSKSSSSSSKTSS